MTLLTITKHFPPDVGGTPTVLANLFSQFPANEIAVISSRTKKAVKSEWAQDILALRKASIGCPDWLSRLFPSINRLYINQMTKIAVKFIHTQNYTEILAILPGPEFAAVAYQAHVHTGIPLFVYYLDTTLPYKGEEPWRRDTLSQYENKWLRSAKGIFVLSEGLAQDLQNRLGVKSYTILRHSLPPEMIQLAEVVPAKLISRDHIRVVFIGSVRKYSHVRPLNLLIQAIESIQNLKIHLEFFTKQTREQLLGSGVTDSPIWNTAFYNNEQILIEERKADLLVVPLDNQSLLQPLLKTVFPTKTVEAMVSGVPILAIAPADTYTAKYARSAGFAYVVDEYTIDAIRTAIQQVLFDGETREKLITSAKQTARQNHDARLVSKLFRQVVYGADV